MPKICQKWEKQHFLHKNSVYLKHCQTIHIEKLWIKVKFMNITYKTINSDKIRLKIREISKKLTVILDIYLSLLGMLDCSVNWGLWKANCLSREKGEV
jgi:hypothetical protein